MNRQTSGLRFACPRLISEALLGRNSRYKRATDSGATHGVTDLILGLVAGGPALEIHLNSIAIVCDGIGVTVVVTVTPPLIVNGVPAGRGRVRLSPFNPGQAPAEGPTWAAWPCKNRLVDRP
jgi:hypothetical protein